MSVFSPSHSVPVKPGYYLLIFSSCMHLRTIGAFIHLHTFVPSFHRQQSFLLGCPLLHLLFKAGTSYLSGVRGELRRAARGADKVA